MVNRVAVDGELPVELTEALITGRARFTADLPVDGVAELVFVRSPHAHARLVSIDTTAARQAPGVLGVFTADDMPAITLHEIHIIPAEVAPPALARGVVRYVGEPVAALVGTSLAHAIDAAELIEVDYEALPSVITADDALAPTAPRLYPERENNVVLSWQLDERDPQWFVDVPAAVTVRGEITIPRLSNAPMEPHAIVVAPDGAGLHIFVSTQWPHGTRVQMARAFGLDLTDVRVQVPAVGGGFGGKTLGGIREHIATAAAARHLGRPVRYVEGRRDNLQTMQGRGVRIAYEADATAEGIVTALRVDDVCDCGAYPSTGAVEPGKTMLMSTGPYRIGRITFRARSVITNLPPTGAYRGPGRSEASTVLEHVMDGVAGALLLDPLDVRRRNLVRAGELPKATVTGIHLDETDFAALIDHARAASGYDEWRDEQRRRRGTTGSLLGIGVATIVDSTAWFDRVDHAQVRLGLDGIVTVEMSSSSAGQHHDRAIARMVGEPLGLEAGAVRLIEGDSAFGTGAGSSGSRTAQITGHAARAGALELRDRLQRAASERFEAAPADIVLAGGRASVRGVPAASIALAELAATLGADELAACCRFEQSAATYPASVNIAVLSIDPDTGGVSVLSFVTVTDCGAVLDAAGAEGQVVGASIQGIAQALFEEMIYDGAGNPLSSSFAEYLVPSAADVPAVRNEFHGFPSSRNPLGAKGVGEIGMVGAPIAIQRAISDALDGVNVPLPADPESVWRLVSQRAG